ncbi:MAG: RNA 2',3'-cyclic phosphodiesterase [Candidatus Moranbacteria bacterium]|nr:RNA 2',3'-cyclic phosphodiesterase [Candidatus Moranbacteria bacterium]
MKQRRVFIGINLPNQVKKRLAQKIEKWRDLPVRWTLEENLHITLAFLGYIEDSVLPDVCSAVREASCQFHGFDLELSKITFGPNVNQIRMVWAVGEPNEELKLIQEEIEKRLKIFEREKREFRPHVTLGRIRKEKWARLPETPAIDEKINLLVPVESIEILESVMEEGKRKYLLLESCPLGR